MMEEQMYSVLDDNGKHVAYHMELSNALLLIAALMDRYYQEPCITYKIMRENNNAEEARCE